MSQNPPVFEVLPRDLSAYRQGNVGIDYVHRFESGKPGPHVLINALTHGNEICGMVAATHLLVPIQSSYFALEGTDDLLETLEKIKARPNPDLQFLGVVITIHDKRTVLARDIRRQIQKVFGDKVFRTTISKSVRLEESPAYKEAIFSFAPDSSGASEYYSVSEEVLSRV